MPYSRRGVLPQPPRHEQYVCDCEGREAWDIPNKGSAYLRLSNITDLRLFKTRSWFCQWSTFIVVVPLTERDTLGSTPLHFNKKSLSFLKMLMCCWCVVDVLLCSSDHIPDLAIERLKLRCNFFWRTQVVSSTITNPTTTIGGAFIQPFCPLNIRVLPE